MYFKTMCRQSVGSFGNFELLVGPWQFSVGDKSMSISVDDSPCESPPEAVGQLLTDFLPLNCVRKYVQNVSVQICVLCVARSLSQVV